MKIQKILTQYLATSLFLVSGALFAQAPDQTTPPDVLIKIVVTEVMTTVKADPDIQKGNIPKIVELVEKKIVPYTDMRRTTEMAMNIMGVWLVEAYRNQFSNQISQNGIEGLVKFLQDRNKQLATAKPAN